jgi:hypothetical protein
MVDQSTPLTSPEIDPGARFTSEEEETMRGTRWLAIIVLALVVGAGPGCQTAGTRRTATVVSPEPAPGDGGGLVAEKTIDAAPVKTVTFADRHPLFTKPRQYWETSGDNKIVKAAAATFIGVPAGFVGEVKQIFVGAPPETRF